jgi:hypothetical protein
MGRPAKNDLLLFHSIPFDQIRQGVIEPDVSFAEDKENIPAYRWLEAEIGFYPLFFAIGRVDDGAVYSVTGYQSNWQRPDDFEEGQAGKTGEPRNQVLFVFSMDILAESLFIEDMTWCGCVLNSAENAGVSARVAASLFKPSWTPSKWRSLARKDGHAVQVVARSVNLGSAQAVYVRNKKTREALLQQGFKNVLVKRVPIYRGWL